MREGDNYVSYWDLLETLIIARLGIDALPNSPGQPDRAEYLKRVVRVLRRTAASEKIQAMWMGRKCRSKVLPTLVHPEDMHIVLKARATVYEFRERGFEQRCARNGDGEGGHTPQPVRVWEPKVSFSVKRCGYVSLQHDTATDDFVTVAARSSGEGRGSAVMIRKVQGAADEP